MARPDRFTRKRKYGHPHYVLRGNQYIAALYRSPVATRPFWRCGNTGVALEVVDLLHVLGHYVEVRIEEDACG